jgi:mRNA interferase RelE/StbE
MESMKEVRYSENAVKQLRKISKGDKKSAKMIVDTIENYAKNEAGSYDVKTLKGEFGNFKRLRVGNYRILFDEEDNIMSIYQVKHRQEAYHD